MGKGKYRRTHRRLDERNVNHNCKNRGDETPRKILLEKEVREETSRATNLADEKETVTGMLIKNGAMGSQR